MAVFYNGQYNSVSDIKGPSGWYWINTSLGPVHTYVDQSYDGGGWVLVLANRAGQGAMSNLTYYDAVNTCNIRTSSNTTVTSGNKLSALSNYDVWIGTKFWSLLSGRVTSSKVTVVQFVAGTNGIALSSTGSHNKRYRWRFDNFNSTYGFVGATGISDETGTGAPGFYSYHAVNGYSLTTYDVDQDVNGGNCATYYGNTPWWFGSCWDGFYFPNGGGYSNYPNWAGAGSQLYQYGAVYIK